MMKITADTNILISSTFWKGAAFKIMELILEGKIELILSEEILKEYYEVISEEYITEKIRRKDLKFQDVIDKVFKISKVVYPKHKFSVIKEDPDDNKILEAAVEGKVDLIITYDNHLLKIGEFRGIRIVTPENFLNVLI